MTPSPADDATPDPADTVDALIAQIVGSLEQLTASAERLTAEARADLATEHHAFLQER